MVLFPPSNILHEEQEEKKLLVWNKKSLYVVELLNRIPYLRGVGD